MEGEGNFDLNAIWEKVNQGEALLIDTRIINEYTKEHIPHSLCAPYSRSGWGDAVSRYIGDQASKIVLLSNNGTIADAARKELEKVGYDVLAQISDGMKSWESSGYPVARMAEIDTEDLYENLSDYTVIDVRDPFEWQSGIIKGAEKIPMDQLPEKLEKLPKDKKYAIVCASGSRSMSAALYMADNGFDAGNVVGGMSRWLSQSLPVEYE